MFCFTLIWIQLRLESDKIWALCHYCFEYVCACTYAQEEEEVSLYMNDPINIMCKHHLLKLSWDLCPNDFKEKSNHHLNSWSDTSKKPTGILTIVLCSAQKVRIAFESPHCVQNDKYSSIKGTRKQCFGNHWWLVITGVLPHGTSSAKPEIGSFLNGFSETLGCLKCGLSHCFLLILLFLFVHVARW